MLVRLWDARCSAAARGQGIAQPDAEPAASPSVRTSVRTRVRTTREAQPFWAPRIWAAEVLRGLSGSPKRCGNGQPRGPQRGK